MTHTFKLERLDGTPANPPSFETTVLVWAPGDQIPLGARRCKWSAFGTTTPTRHPSWSFRTWPKERLAPSTDVS
jgi:hypothetical protein